MVDTDRITGAAKEFGGKVQGAVGDLTGSHKDSAEGRAREAAGQAEGLYGQAKDTVRDAAGHVADTARDIGGKVREALGDVIGSDDLESRARHAQGAAQDYGDRAGRTIRRSANEAADYAEDIYGQGRHALHRGTREVSHRVGEHPLASVVVAGLVGFGIGLLVSASRD